MLMYQDKDNRSNHAEALNRFQRSVDYNDSVTPITSSTFKLSNQMEVRDTRHTDTVTLMHYNQIVSNRSVHENNAIRKNASGLSNVARSLSKLMIYNLFSDLNKKPNFRRFENYTTQNSTTTESEISDHGLIVWRKPRARALRRMRRASEERVRNEKKGETRRRSEEESGKQRQSEENERTRLLQSEEKGEERRSEGKSKMRRQSEKKGEKRQNRRGHKRNRRQSSTYISSLSILIIIFFIREIERTNCIVDYRCAA